MSPRVGISSDSIGVRIYTLFILVPAVILAEGSCTPLSPARTVTAMVFRSYLYPVEILASYYGLLRRERPVQSRRIGSVVGPATGFSTSVRIAG